MSNSIKVIIPAFNERNAVGNVINEIPKDIVDEIIVVDNGSTDDTCEVAKKCGAVVLREDIRGYGRACLKGMAYIAEQSHQPDIIVFLDGDYSDYPEEITELVAPIISNSVDMVIGSRSLGIREKGSMTIQQIFGNWLATTLMRFFYKANYSDLGPFRAIRYDSLVAINMQDKTYGWTIEMQIKAAKMGLRSKEVPVNYRKRIGVSKISGTLSGTLAAGYKIIHTIIKYR
ncbi:glycosyltransferase family 2 protein [Agarilytica rhodophyticola]|uniref:glycosyltransferase family 2 protein n=1 Tax=Agarilytica rhodophyticola TaxID=1737490 RepID=UPI000B3446D5|nr:glycosyltransferase family 2 protein [Agarilytica rhodophyticola]